MRGIFLVLLEGIQEMKKILKKGASLSMWLLCCVGVSIGQKVQEFYPLPSDPSMSGLAKDSISVNVNDGGDLFLLIESATAMPAEKHLQLITSGGVRYQEL